MMKKRMAQIAFLLIAATAMWLSSILFAVADEQEGDYTYTVADGKATVTGYMGPGGDVTIPETLGGYPVVALGNSIFVENHDIVSVRIPDGLTSIGDYVFKQCWSLSEVSMPNSILAIGCEAFEGCGALSALSLPDNLSFIGEGAFSYCDDLSSISLPAGITAIPAKCFQDCTGLKSINILGAVVSIGDYAFDTCYRIESLTLPDSIRDIGNYTFRSCAFDTILLPDNLASIGNSAFASCDLVSISIPNSVNTIGSSTFYGDTYLAEVHLPDNLDKISSCMFSGCHSLKNFTIPDNVITVENEAFANSGLVEFTFNANITNVGTGIFRDCTFLKSISVPDCISNIGTMFQGSCMESILIPATNTNIADYAFSDCRKLKTVTIPSGVTSIGKYAFEDCECLESITLPSSVTHISEYSFNYSGLIQISIPSSVTEIDSYAFRFCERLETITFPESIHSINDSTFYGCKSLSHISAPGVVRIESNAFTKCSNLASIDLPDYMEYIQDYAFRQCESLVDFTFPAGLSQIAVGVLSECTNLRTVYIIADIKSIQMSAFLSCRNLETLSIPSSVTLIDRYAFCNCASLKSITLPSCLETIGDNCFAGCSSLSYILFPENVINISNNALSNCTMLKRVDFSASRIGISENTFKNCTALESVFFCGGKPSINNKAFAGASSTFKLYYHVKQSSSWSDFTLYPCQAYCYLTQDLNDGSKPVTEIKYLNESQLPQLEQPNRTGYEFDGWYKDSACTCKWNFTSDMVTGDMTLYAGWIIPLPAQMNAESISYNSIRLTWNTVPGATGYEVWRSVSSGGTYAQIADATTANYTDTGLTTGLTYWYKLKSYNVTNGTRTASGFSSAVSAKPLLVVPCSVSAASASHSNIKLTWSAVPGAAGYEVWRSASSGGTYAKVADATSASYTNTGLTTGKTYWYKLKSYTMTNSTRTASGFSASVSAKPMPAAPGSVKAASASYNSIKVSWGAVAGATKYELWSSTSASGKYKKLTTTSSRSYTNKSLTTGKAYYYKVRAYHTEGSTKVYGGWSAVVNAKPTLGTPASLKAARASATSIKLTWKAVSGRTKYEIWRCDTASGTYKLIGTTTYTYYTNTKLTAGKTYYYKVRANRTVSGKKVYGGWTGVVTGKP